MLFDAYSNNNSLKQFPAVEQKPYYDAYSVDSSPKQFSFPTLVEEPTLALTAHLDDERHHQCRSPEPSPKSCPSVRALAAKASKGPWRMEGREVDGTPFMRDGAKAGSPPRADASPTVYGPHRGSWRTTQKALGLADSKSDSAGYPPLRVTGKYVPPGRRNRAGNRTRRMRLGAIPRSGRSDSSSGGGGKAQSAPPPPLRVAQRAAASVGRPRLSLPSHSSEPMLVSTGGWGSPPQRGSASRWGPPREATTGMSAAERWSGGANPATKSRRTPCGEARRWFGPAACLTRVGNRVLRDNWFRNRQN